MPWMQVSTDRDMLAYLIESVEHGTFLQEIRDMLLPVEFIWLRHGCSQIY